MCSIVRWRLLALFSFTACVWGDNGAPAGHLKPLGAHREPQQVASLIHMPTPDEFYHSYVRAGRPVLLSGLLNSTTTLDNWSKDTYLRETFGEEEVEVELGKKENRTGGAFVTTMADYVDRYEIEDIYLVMQLPLSMRKEWILPRFLLCGGYTSNLMNSYLWFSSGGTKSVLHTDSFENLHCLVSGVKEFVLIEPHYSQTIGSEHERQGFYNIDVDRVDMLAYPGMASVPWHSAVVRAGDCLYLPYEWIHHVRSYGRNMAVNVWWIQFQFDQEGCSSASELPGFTSLGKFNILPELQLKQALMKYSREDGSVYASDILRSMIMRMGHASLNLELVIQMFDRMKPDCNGTLSTSDIHSIPIERLKSAFEYFASQDPNLGNSPDQSEDEEWKEKREGEWKGEREEEWKEKRKGEREGEWKEKREGEWKGEREGEREWGYSEYHDDDIELEEGGGDYHPDHLPHDEL